MRTSQIIQKDMQAKAITPLVSFIVTTYNIPGKMLRECLASILALSLSKEQKEIILVDDGSTEPAINSIKEFADDVLYIRQRNRGVSVARNIGLKNATGQYIQFVDGDDYLLQQQYEHCLDILRYRKCGDMVMFHITDNNRPPMATTYSGPMSGVKFMTENNLRGSACGYIFKKSLLTYNLFTEGIVYGEDELFTAKLMLEVKNMFFTDAQAYYYRNRNNSITHRRSKKNIDKHLKDYISVISCLKELSLKVDEKKKEALERRIAQLSMDYLYNVIILTKSRSMLRKAKAILKNYGLYPLPDNNYTIKYALFRKLI